MSARVLLLMPTTSYKAQDFLAAAERLGVEVVTGTDRRQALEEAAPGNTLAFEYGRVDRAVQRIVEEHRHRPFRAVLGVDDETTVLAATAAEALGLPHNPVPAVRAARDKHETRRAMLAAGMATPWFFLARLEAGGRAAVEQARYPCVLKPLRLSASRGVIRADDDEQFLAAFERIASILGRTEVERKGGDTEHLLVEAYLPGAEVALEGLLHEGRLRMLALFDKPDPLEGPTFEETIYLTPSGLPAQLQSALAGEAAEGCRALGLREGPVHAELRIHDGGCRLLEVAARTIGGRCSRVLRFGAGVSLEELVLSHALGRDVRGLERERRAAGVMMIPVPRPGVLRLVGGLDRARTVPHVEEVTITSHRGARLVPTPDGDRYLGFIFARAEDARTVERALRNAHETLTFTIE